VAEGELKNDMKSGKEACQLCHGFQEFFKSGKESFCLDFFVSFFIQEKKKGEI
jgi:hypothetical protein